jgi:hypothetical protein
MEIATTQTAWLNWPLKPAGTSGLACVLWGTGMRIRAGACLFSLVAAVTAFSVDVAVAQSSLRSFKVGSWNGGAFAGPDGRFTHCAASDNYNPRIKMQFSINRQYQWNIGFSSPVGD